MSYERILIVEENQDAASQMADILARKEFDVVNIVTSGENAIETAENVPLDLILLDLELKGKPDGITTAAEILSFKDLPIVFMAPHPNKDLIIRARDILLYGFLTKPIDEHMLISTIRRALIWHSWCMAARENESRYYDMYRAVYQSRKREDNSSHTHDNKRGDPEMSDYEMAS